MKNVVISLCDKTGNMVKPWAEAGFECWCIDVQHSIRRERVERVGQGSIHYVWGDIRTWGPSSELAGRIKILFAFPPCTHVAVSGARDFRTKNTGLLRDSLELFSACEHAAKWSGAPYMIENPVGKFSDHMGKPDFTFHPWEYGDLWTKKTCLWTGGDLSCRTRFILKCRKASNLLSGKCPLVMIALINGQKPRPVSHERYSKQTTTKHSN